LDASIIIPVRNGSRFIAECLESCLAQETEFQFEIILIDDNSTDNTLNIASDFSLQKKVPFRILRNAGSGISSALNLGIASSTAKYILRLDADDRMLKNRVQEQVQYAQDNPDLVLLGSQIRFIGEQAPNLTPNQYPLTDLDLRRALSKGCYFAHPSVLIRRLAIIDVGSYNSNMDGAEDYELWLLLCRIGSIENLDSVLTEYRIHPNQFTVSRKFDSLKATAKVRIFFILNIGRFNSSKKEFGKSISRSAMFKSLLQEIVIYTYSYLRSKH